MFFQLLFRLLLAMLFLSLSCKVPQPQTYSFFVAGHTYGAPTDTLPGMHPPFVAEFDFLRSIKNSQLGVLTGDIVFRSTKAHWDAVDRELSALDIPVYFAAGNHDEGHKSPYRERYGATYYKWKIQDDLFLVLNPGLGGWNIWKEQMTFLKKTLKKAKRYRRIFVFFHQVLWWSPEGPYSDLKINSLDGRTPQINFWSEVEPLFQAADRPVYLFAGDVGANRFKTPLFYDSYKNIHLLASGMGNGEKDNFLIVNVTADNTVTIAVKWLGSMKMEILPLKEEKQ